MKAKDLTIAAILIAVTMYSCKKDDDSTPVAPTIITNPPPATDYIYGSLFTSFSTGTALKSNWTTDGKKYSQFTDEFNGWSENTVNICGNNIVLSYTGNANANEVAYASLSDLNTFNKINSSKQCTEVGMINGVVVASASKGNNFYTGQCNTKAGESNMTFNLLPLGTSFYKYQLLGNMLISQVQSNGGTNLGYTQDGINWTITNEPINNANYEYFDGKIWAFNSQMAASNSGTDLSTGWLIDTLYDAISNTTDTNGTFYVSSRIIPLSNNWLIYGSISSFSSGIHYPCVNVSTDHGQTWKTSFLSGVSTYTNNTSWSGEIVATNSIVIINHNDGGTFPVGIYSSSNGLDFTLWTDAKAAEKYTNFYNPRAIR